MLKKRQQQNQSAVVVHDYEIKAARRPVAELFRRLNSREASGSASGSASASSASESDFYHTASLNLLSLAEPTTNDRRIITTVEDYLFFALWDIAGGDAGNVSPILSSAAVTTATNAVSALGDQLITWGPSHFQQSTDVVDPWSYAFPLLMSQKWETALSHLAETGGAAGLMEATHVAIVLGKRGAFGDDEHSVNNTLLKNLIVAYSSTLQGVDPEASVEYLARIPGTCSGNSGVSDAARSNIKRLLLETRSYGLLVGNVGPDGVRDAMGGGGCLDSFFSNNEVTSLLTECATEIIREGGGASVGDAAQLLLLAGKYGKLLTLLNRALASRLCGFGNVEEAEERQFWKATSFHFSQVYLKSGRTYVLEALEAEGQSRLCLAFDLLLNVTNFFDLYREGEWTEAWEVLARQGLFPNMEGEMAGRVENYHSMLDASIKQHFHEIVLAGMECLYNIHLGMKGGNGGAGGGGGGGGGGGNAQVVAQAGLRLKLKELSAQARLLITFTGLINHKLPSDYNTKIASMEALMM